MFDYTNIVFYKIRLKNFFLIEHFHWFFKKKMLLISENEI